MQDILISIKWGWQRLTRGYDDRIFYSLASYIDPMIVAHCEYLRLEGHGTPISFTEKKWKKILDTIIKGLSPEPDWKKVSEWKKYRKDREKALVLLAMHWDELWD